jgi:hypothetical protein
MVRKSGGAWYPVTPGRIAPSTRRAVTVLLASRAELPPALAAELESYEAALDGTGTGATERAQQLPNPARSIAAS